MKVFQKTGFVVIFFIALMPILFWQVEKAEGLPALVKDINLGPVGSVPNWLVNVNGTIFFTADDAVHGYELWKSNGTATGTVMVKDINPGAGDSEPYGLVNMNGTLFFAATDGVRGLELWAYPYPLIL